MRGYILAISSVLLFFVLFIFVQNVLVARNKILSSLQESLYIEKVGHIASDLSRDIRNVLSLELGLGSNITISDNLAVNKSQFFSALSTFLPIYANKTSANISIGYSDPLKIVAGDIVYSSFFNGSVKFLNVSGTTNVQFYLIRIVGQNNYTNYTAWSWQPSGIYVTINYSDPSGAFVESGYVDPIVINSFVINYPGENVTIVVGPVDGSVGALALYQTGQLALLNLTTNLPPQALPPSYNVIANISSPAASFYGPLPA